MCFGPKSSEHPARTVLYWRMSSTRVVFLQRRMHKKDEYFPLFTPVLFAHDCSELGAKLSVGSVCFRLKLRVWDVLAKTTQPHLSALGGIGLL